jgi:hypothetical protein
VKHDSDFPEKLAHLLRERNNRKGFRIRLFGDDGADDGRISPRPISRETREAIIHVASVKRR